ncbi:hypothetical protein HML84_06210 [Alcanivorax sp. IO_7]|nr:hypothetical protein HML84_06210 [Alcanivorax sp. IO_7]
MKRLDDLTVKSSWSLVLAAFTLMVLLIGGVSGYANHHNGRPSRRSTNCTPNAPTPCAVPTLPCCVRSAV